MGMRYVILLRCSWIKVECRVENGELNSDISLKAFHAAYESWVNSEFPIASPYGVVLLVIVGTDTFNERP